MGYFAEEDRVFPVPSKACTHTPHKPHTLVDNTYLWFCVLLVFSHLHIELYSFKG